MPADAFQSSAHPWLDGVRRPRYRRASNRVEARWGAARTLRGTGGAEVGCDGMRSEGQRATPVWQRGAVRVPRWRDWDAGLALNTCSSHCRGGIVGPIVLFDKSFLQSLNLDESVWFDHFYYPVICPLFFVETLADLEKAVQEGRTPEQEVGSIAGKTPEVHGTPCAHHGGLCIGDLMGHPVPMDGRIPVAGGRLVKVDGRKGAVCEESPEAQAFSRWQRGSYLEVERQFAQVWRSSLRALDLLATADGIRAIGVDAKTCRSLQDAKRMARAVVNAKDSPIDCMRLASLFLNVPRQFEQPIVKRWRGAGCPPLATHSPFAAHVLTVEVFFQIALRASLISADRPSNRVDIAYLFYLPFCMAFVSSDRLHGRCAPHFLRPDQEFVLGPDLKADLKRLNDHYSQLPESERETGITRFAPQPPETGEYLVSRLWDRYLPSWRDMSPGLVAGAPGQDREILERHARLSGAPTLSPEEVDFGPDEVEMISMQRPPVRRQKGSWWQVPKNLDVSGTT